MNRILITIVLLLGLIWCAPSSCFSQDQEFKIGVLANRGAPQAFKEWKATADFLSAKTGKNFTIVPLEYDQLPEWTKEMKADFILTNSAMYAELHRLYGLQAIATQVNKYKDLSMDKFGSTILVKSDSPAKNLADFKGKDFACASRSAFGGWLMTVRLFMENGINPEAELGSLRELKTHDNVVYAVLNGAVAGGSVRTGTLEKMIQEGKVKVTDFRIIQQIPDDFPLAHSTQLYPEYPFAACQHVPQAVKQQVAKALIAIPATDPANTSAKIFGWKEPLDYGPVIECLAMIKYGVFKDQAASAAAAQPPAPTAPAPEKIAESPSVPPQATAGQAKTQARIPRVRASTQ
jgi:two-component system, LuxR family, sensor histidine kinase TtrS